MLWSPSGCDSIPSHVADKTERLTLYSLKENFVAAGITSEGEGAVTEKDGNGSKKEMAFCFRESRSEAKECNVLAPSAQSLPKCLRGI